MTDRPKRMSRRWWRLVHFSVRGLIVLVLVVACWMSWIVRSARIQREAVKAIEKAGGVVSYDCHWRMGRPVWNGRPAWLRCLVECLGSDYFCNAVYVAFIVEHGSDAELVHIGHLSRLRTLFLDASPITDAGMAHLSGLTRLEDLGLGGTDVTDAGLAHLDGLSDLKYLNFAQTKVTGAGFTHLRGLKRLDWLSFRATEVGSAALAHL